ncbi:MAG: O-antigen ligase family protein, partial [Candidatus Nitrotoga sp.]
MPSIAHISLTLVGLMWVLPFLYFYHAYPLTTFYQEWIAAVLGLCAMPLLVTKRYWLQPKIPSIAFLPIGLLLLGTMQFVLGRVSYFDHILLLSLYLLWAALLMMLGRRLCEELGLPALATTLAIFLLVGAELNALAGILQHYSWHTFLDVVVTAKVSVAVYGNVAQPNHFANYITLGLISLGLLHMCDLLRARYVLLLTMPLLFVLVLSGSRSVWLYLLFMAGMAWLWQRNDKSCLPLLRYTLLLLPGFGLMHAVVQIPWLEGAAGSITTMRSLFGEGTGGSIRLYLWREGWQIFSQFPLLGAGFGQFAWQHFKIGPVLQRTDIVGMYNNAHSLVIQIAAEMGLAGLLVFLGMLAMWLIQC